MQTTPKLTPPVAQVMHSVLPHHPSAAARCERLVRSLEKRIDRLADRFTLIHLRLQLVEHRNAAIKDRLGGLRARLKKI
jgi:hypothetical protein